MTELAPITREQIMSYALGLFARQNYTEFQIREKIEKKFDPGHQLLHAVVQRLQELGYINDDAYAKRYLELCQANKTYSLLKVRHNLQKRGVDSTLIQRYINDTEFYDEVVILEKIRAHSYADYDDLEFEAQQKIKSKLQRQGFFVSNVIKVFP